MQIHSNATTNVKQRDSIRRSSRSCRSLANQYRVSISTINKWKGRDSPYDRSSRPGTVHYALHSEEGRLALFLRGFKMSLDDILDSLKDVIPHVGRSNLYRLLVRHGMGRIPRKHDKGVVGKFRDYEPGFLHIDFFHLPMLEGKRRYCFVAIDRATRLLFLRVYEGRDKRAATDFLTRCLEFFPFRIKTILTDNGGEFTNHYYKHRQGVKVKSSHPFAELCRCEGIDHRKTRIWTPKTNGLAERAIGLIQEGTTKRHVYPSADAMLADLKAWFIHYNFYRPHRRIGRVTPYVKAREWYERNPDLFIKEPTHLLYFCSQRGET